MDYWTTWGKAAGIRAIRTFAQGALAMIGTNVIGVTEVDWIGVLSAAALSAVLSLLTSLAGLPEIPEERYTEQADDIDHEVR